MEKQIIEIRAQGDYLLIHVYKTSLMSIRRFNNYLSSIGLLKSLLLLWFLMNVSVCVLVSVGGQNTCLLAAYFHFSHLSDGDKGVACGEKGL